jgi:hypothetical protein
MRYFLTLLCLTPTLAQAIPSTTSLLKLLLLAGSLPTLSAHILGFPIIIKIIHYGIINPELPIEQLEDRMRVLRYWFEMAENYYEWFVF